jgi:hypothetical protein
VREKIHFYIYLAGLCLIAFFLPLSEFIISAAIFMLLTNWFAELNFKTKFKRLFEDKSVLIFLLIFFVHIIWLINTHNFGYALKDIRIKLPLLALPVIFATSFKLNYKQIYLICVFFIFGVLISSVVGVLMHHRELFSQGDFNVRQLSVFISHIRLSLMSSFSIMLIIYFWAKKIFITNIYLKIFSFTILLWFLIFLGLVEGFTGIFALLTAGIFVILLKGFYSKNINSKIAFISLGVLIPVISFWGVFNEIRHFYKPTADNTLLEVTAGGNNYFHDTTVCMLENGNPVYINICEKELHWAWAKRSNVGLDKTDSKGNPILHTLIRYLASKGLPKDAEAVLSLHDEDIMNIENGITNYRFAQPKIISDRVYEIIWQLDYYLKGGNPSGHSLSQRIEYLKYGLILSYRYFFNGTGTGDIDDAFKALYIEKKSELEPQFRHRTHNQFITFFASFGVFGFLLIIIGMFYPIFKNLENLNWSFFSFMIIIILSMFSDETLETATGVAFFSFFYCLFIWGRENQVENK